MEALYEDQVTLFLDFLGFSEASVQLDEGVQTRLLSLLRAIASMQGDFLDNSDPAKESGGRAVRLRPTTTTFSDHIVASYPVSRVMPDLDENARLSIVLFDVSQFVAKIAAAALLSGFLVRGGLSYGKLYHTRGVVFGGAMVEAYRLESTTAIYPRVVVAPRLMKLAAQNAALHSMIPKGFDGLGFIDYFIFLTSALSPPGPGHATHTKQWFEEAIPILRRQIDQLKEQGSVNALAKWVWFAKALADALRRTNPVILQGTGIAASDMLWADQL